MAADIYQRHQARSAHKLHVLMKDKSVQERETAVRRGVKRLELLQSILVDKSLDGHVDITQWNEQASKAITQASQKKAVIGVVGNTGAGKTSLINAILGEGRLLPTNCMRACTATVTEIGYNYHSSHNYVADIEYIDAEEWREELELGWKILFDQSGKIVRDATSEDSDAGVFYAKMKAVYTDLTRDELQRANIDALMDHSSMAVLGTVERIEDEFPASFSRRLQFIIDSKDHSDDTESTLAPKNSVKRRGNWPLIRKAKILLKSSALSTGVTLVDLPGVQDSNPARVKIATDYLSQCSGLLVATPIHRAVDDKVAKHLLGKTFKRQIMMDGGFNTVTFVCTKADDISIVEASSSLSIEHRIAQLTNEARDHQTTIAALKMEIEKLQKAKSDAEADLQKAYEKQDQYEDLRLENEKLDNGTQTPGKRPGQETVANPFNKRQAVQTDATDNGARNPLVAARNSKNSEANGSVEGSIRHWIGERRRLQSYKQDMSEKLENNTNQLHSHEVALSKIEAQKVSLCITERNKYVQDALKRDFVAGVKEFDKERLGDGNEQLDQGVVHRDYNKLHEQLPVFCVSAKAFQKKLGLLEQEPDILGFATNEDTGIPKLQDHCKQLTDAGRMKSADYFLAMLSALLNSLSLWITKELSGTLLTEEQRVVFKQSLENELTTLESRLVKVTADICGELKDRIRHHLYKSFEPAWINATNEAHDKVKGWNQLAHQTWRAVCVRNGSFENGNGKYDWNEELVEPILETLAPKWETAFNDFTTKTFGKFGLSCRKATKDFHRSVPNLFDEVGSRTPESYEMLENQLENYKHAFQSVEDYGKDTVSGQQRMISRAFKPVIRDGMMSAYKHCLEETGSGSWKRMKQHMADHITSSPGMFRDSTKAVQGQIDNLIRDVRQEMTAKVQAIYDDIWNDYVNTLVGRPARDENGRPTKFIELLLNFIDGTERDFKELSNASGQISGEETLFLQDSGSYHQPPPEGSRDLDGDGASNDVGLCLDNTSSVEEEIGEEVPLNSRYDGVADGSMED